LAIARDHPPICIWGYGDYTAYFNSKIKVISCGINGSSKDLRFLAYHATFNDLYEKMVVCNENLTVEEVALLKQVAKHYFEGDHHPYFAKLGYVITTYTSYTQHTRNNYYLV
jgi:hypothetical protein